jgi:hypothetical protein
MLVPEGTRLAHYWRNNDDSKYPWRKAHVYKFGGTSSGKHAARFPRSVAMIRSTIQGDGVHGNFDAVVRLHSKSGNHDVLAFVAFDTSTRTWTMPLTLTADGETLHET